MAYLTNPTTNSIWKFLPFGSPLSAMRLASHREDQHDLTDSSWVSVGFWSGGHGASDRPKKWSYNSSINPMH
jgi:hypothetical protein